MPSGTGKLTGPGLKALLDGSVIWGGDDLYYGLGRTAFSLNIDTLDFWNDVNAADEVTGTNWAAGGVQADGEALSLVTASDRVELDITDEAVSSVTLSDAKYLFIYSRTPGTDATREVVGYVTWDTALAPQGGTLTLDFSVDGFAYISYA